MNNVIDIRGRLSNWKLIDSWYSGGDAYLIEVHGNYQPNVHEISIRFPGSQSVDLGIVDIARLQKAIKEYEER